ncbi:MAG: DUF2189 domain-containing protein [Gammaproteobacteria bacterium]|nr:DUF2189 domain-containing protein [Gammaproteobacteria bacterium]
MQSNPAEPQPSPRRFVAPPIREVGLDAVVRWLQLGWHDLRASGWPSLMHGLIVTAVSVVIVEMTLFFWPLLPGAVSGFLVVGPILATGLYALSRQLEQGVKPDTRHVYEAWRRGTRCLYRFGLLLVLAATTWVLFSMSLFHYFVSTDIERPLDFLRYVLLQHDGIFLLWTILAGLVAAVTFAVTVVSVPLLVDRDVNTPLALATSVRAVAENPLPMTLWALLILLATAFSIATFMLGFVVLYPVLGHASWYVYRDIVDVSRLPPRQPVE